MTGRILNDLKQKIKGWKLIPSSGGCFELRIDGELIYSKLATGAFPDETAILKLFRERVNQGY